MVLRCALIKRAVIDDFNDRPVTEDILMISLISSLHWSAGTSREQELGLKGYPTARPYRLRSS